MEAIVIDQAYQAKARSSRQAHRHPRARVGLVRDGLSTEWEVFCFSASWSVTSLIKF